MRAAVDDAFRTLSDRYLGGAPGCDATYQVRLGDLGRTYEVRCTPDVARVGLGGTSRRPDVVLGTDAETWLALRAGDINGIEAFSQRRLYVRGRLDAALAFEGLFRRPDGGPPLLRVHDVPTGVGAISTLTVGEGPDVLLVHGLGAAKSSMLELAASLAREGRRVHAIDLPGFGSSAKPALSPYDPAWFVAALHDWLDATGVECAHVVGNSMGGRLAIELALRHPERVRSLALLSPAVAFVRRDMRHVVRLLRPEVGALPHSIRRATVTAQLWGMFCDPDALDPSVADVVVDEFRRTYASAGARMALLKSARHLYLSEPFGKAGFYPRLRELRAPSLFVWGTHDRLIPAGFAHHVEEWLPSAQQIVLDRCGHVPQVERAEQTAGLVRRFFAQVDALGAPARAAA